MICKFCGHECKKDGHQANGTQRYECKHCHRKQQEGYKYNAYSPDLDRNIVLYTKEGVGVRSTSRILKISPTTLLRHIILIAKRISHPPIVKRHIWSGRNKKFRSPERQAYMDCLRYRPHIERGRKFQHRSKNKYHIECSDGNFTYRRSQTNLHR